MFIGYICIHICEELVGTVSRPRLRLLPLGPLGHNWAANERFEIPKFKFNFPKARNFEIIGLVIGFIEAKFCK